MNKASRLVSVLFLIAVAIFFSICSCTGDISQQLVQEEHSPSPAELSAHPSLSESPTNDNDSDDGNASSMKKISITYGISDEREKYGNTIQYYTYDIEKQALSLEAELPFSAQYAVGSISPYDEKLYYSQRSDDDNPSSDDHLLAMSLVDGTVTTIDDSHYSYNDIVVVDKDTVLATTVAHDQTIQPTVFHSDDVMKLFDTWFTEKYTLRPCPISYNHSFGTFVGVYVDKSDFESLEYRRGGVELDHYVALMGTDPKEPPTAVCTIPLNSLELLNMAVQISESEVLISIIDNADPGLPKTYYVIDFSSDVAMINKAGSPFPDNLSVSNCLSLGDGSQMVCLGSLLNDGAASNGLFLYNQNTKELHPIITDELGGHVVNYASIQSN